MPLNNLVTDIPASTYATNTTTSVAASITAISILTAKSARKSLFLKNTSATATVYVRCGTVAAAGATAALHDVEIPPRRQYEWPTPVWVGELNAIWSAANGALIVSEGE